MHFNSMRDFKQITIGLLTLIASGCAGSDAGNYQAKTMIARLGPEPTLFASGYTTSAVSENLVVTIDEPTRTVQEFTLEPFALNASWPLPFDTRGQKLMMSHDAGYFVIVSGADYAVMRRDGHTTINPVELPGTINTYSYDARSHALALSDSYGSIALLALTPDGDVASQWISGPLIAGATTAISAGVMLQGARLVLATNPNEVLIADLTATIAAQAWQTRKIPLEGAGKITWLAAIPSQPGRMLVLGATRLMIVDVDSGAVLDELPTEGKNVVGAFRDLDPHIVTLAGTPSDAGSGTRTVVQIHYATAEGRFAAASVLAAGRNVAESWLDVARGMVTYRTGSEAGGLHPSEVLRYRLSDSLLTARILLVNAGSTAVTPGWLFSRQDSALGRAERLAFSRTAVPTVIEGYNIPLLADGGK